MARAKWIFKVPPVLKTRGTCGKVVENVASDRKSMSSAGTGMESSRRVIESRWKRRNYYPRDRDARHNERSMCTRHKYGETRVLLSIGPTSIDSAKLYQFLKLLFRFMMDLITSMQTEEHVDCFYLWE